MGNIEGSITEEVKMLLTIVVALIVGGLVSAYAMWRYGEWNTFKAGVSAATAAFTVAIVQWFDGVKAVWGAVSGWFGG